MFTLFLTMIKVAITSPLTKQEIQSLVQFLSNHLGYAPLKIPNIIFAKNAKTYAELYENYESKSKELSEEKIIEINNDTPAFYDHMNDLAVFQAFSYKDGVEIDTFIIPMSTILHELIHFFQYATGTFGSYKTMYEGSNDILSCLFTDDPRIDYKKEAMYAMGLAMEINDHDLFRALQWLKTWTTHSDKNSFIHRSIKQCPSFSKYNPRKLMGILDDDRLDKIENEETRAIFIRYSIPKLVRLLRKSYKIINGII